LFLLKRHIVKIASHIKGKLPNVKIMIWDDMLHSIGENVLTEHVRIINKNKQLL